MELRHLRYFIAVAEELHFTRAAERLGIQQPPLSLQIRQLEEELGTPLFRRLTRGVRLTESGIWLLDEARRILEHVERVKAGVQSRARGETGRVRVGFAGATYFHPLVPSAIGAFRQRYPGVVLLPEQSNTPHLIAGLRAGEIDVAFIRPPVTESEGLAFDLLVEEPMLVVLPAAHARAGERSIPLAAIAEDTLILFPRQTGPGLYDAVIAACQQAGFSPEIGQEAPQITSTVHMVAAGFGVSIVPQSVQQIHAEGVAYLRIQGDAPCAQISLAYRRGDQSAAVQHFVGITRRYKRVR
ncbi:MAG TPA: LysR family transcriptional regulator [Dongiaceae bacterium]|nr:LysR family transcriptional regulator [Dongiaceae bacterium]